MFFENVYVFAFTRPFTTTDLELHAALGHHEFTPLGSTELRHFGWVRPISKNGNFTVMSNGNTLICARSEEKILPAQYMKECIDEKAEAIESEQGRGVTKKEREQIKEDVIFDMLPRAFTRTVDTNAYINAEQNTIVVNASSRGKAEDLLALLRKTLGTLPVTSITPDVAPDEIMTGWFEKNSVVTSSPLGVKFKKGYESELRSLGDESPVVRVKDMYLDCEQFTAHLDDDMYVTKIALEYDETMSFMLNDDLSIKRIKFFDVVTEQNDDIDCDDAQAKLTADFTLMAGELNRMIHDLLAEFSVDVRDYQEAE